MSETFRVSEDGKSITCLTCGMTSHNEHDVGMKYCGHCHKYHLLGSVCDFCLGEYPLPRVFLAQNRVIGELVDGRAYIPEPEWGACEACARFIDNGEWEELIVRAIAGCDAKWGPDRPEASAYRMKIMFIYAAVFGKRFTEAIR